MADRVNGSLSIRKFSLWLAGGFAMCALLLAVTGLYGVMAYSVGQRRREMGLRIALGATSSRVSRMVLGQGLRLVLLGSLLGALGSLAVTHIFKSQLFEIKSYDPQTLVVAVGFLLATAAAACWVPARRAAHVQPVTALRQE
jgi:ABC-type antimicrobial peptide transport system permease subunit